MHSDADWNSIIASIFNLLPQPGRRHLINRALTISNHHSYHWEEEEAHLRSLRPEGWRHRQVRFVHRNQANFVQVESAEAKSNGQGLVWTLLLLPIETDRNILMEGSINGISADEIAEMRARLLLLDEKPNAPKRAYADLLQHYIGGSARDVQTVPGIMKKLWKECAHDPSRFLLLARLQCVFLLKITSTCEHILDLTLGPIVGDQMHVRFRGQRHERYSNEQPTQISVEGEMALS